MGIEEQTFHLWTQENNEASADIEAGMAVDSAGLKATAGGNFAGICQFETPAGGQCTLRTGEVLVQVTGTGSAQASLEVSATAGVLQSTVTTGDLIVGQALEAWTAAGLIKALIKPAPYTLP